MLVLKWPAIFRENFFLANSEAAIIFLLVSYTYKFFFENPMYIHGDTKIGILDAKVPKCRDSMNFNFFLILS